MAKSVEDKALRSAYGKLTREQKERFFPGQIEQAKKIIGSLMWLLGSNCEVDRLFELYLTVAARVQMGFDHERIGTTTKMRFSDLVPGNKTSSVVACIERIIRNFAYIDRINSPEMKAAVRTFDLQNERTFRENDKRFEDAERIPGFGTNPANPVFAHFSFGSYRYLNLLYTDDNTPLTWNRLGSVGTESSNDILDQYELLLPDGTVYLIVYVNMYARKESIFCPTGLIGDGLKTVPEQASTHASSSSENTEEASEDEEYTAFLRDYAKDSPTKKNQEPQESSGITANPADDDQSKHDEGISDRSNDANVLVEPEEVLNERTTPVLLGSFPIILEKYAIVKKDGQIYASCSFLSVSHKPIRAVQLDLACYNVWHESVASVTGFQYGDLRVRRDESFGGDQLIPLPDATTRSIEVNVSRVAFTDGALLQKSATENTDVPALLSLETYLGSSELCDEYKAQTYDNAEYAPIRLGAFWRCTCGAMNGEIEHSCHKCGDSVDVLFDHLDISALQASIEKKKQLQREREERERIEREEARQKAEEEASARRMQEEADAQRRAEKRKRLGKRIAVASAVIIAAALVVYLIVWQVIPGWKYHQADKLLQGGDRALAYDAFISLGDFKDSSDRANEIRYEDAELALSNGDFDTACSIFTSLSDYKDSQIQANEAVYQKGTAALDNGDFDTAHAVFGIIPEYKDSKTKAQESFYRKATLLMEAESYYWAAIFFDLITDYKDSKKQRDYCLNEQAYATGNEYLDEGVFQKAGESFESLGSYRDSAQLMLKSYYLYAKDLAEKGDFHEAYVILSAKINHDGSGYEDSVDLANASEYRYASDCFDEGRFIEAAESFSVLGDYEDSVERCLEAQYQNGLVLISTGNFDDAEKQFKELDDYKDSPTQNKEARYQRALQYLSQGEYTAAARIFAELNTYKDSQTQQKEAQYQEALSKTKNQTFVQDGKMQRIEKNLKRAVALFKELGDFKDSKEQWKKAMYAYVLENRNNEDLSTYEYLKELKKYDYQQSKSIYEELYKWSVTLVAANTTDGNDTSIYTRVSKTAAYFHFVFRLEGGPPGEKVTLSHKVFGPDGRASSGNWYWEDKKRGNYLYVEWPNGIYDPQYAKAGDLIFRIYIKSTGELIGQASVTLY